MTYPPEAASAGRPPLSRRLLAWCADFALVVLAGYALALMTVHRIGDLLIDLPAGAEVDAWHLLTADGDAARNARHLAVSLWTKAVTMVVQAFALLVAGTFLYHWTALARTGRTLGKRLFGLRVTPRSVRGAALRAAVTTAADVACFSLACCLLVSGSFVAAVLVWALAVVVFWTNGLMALSRTGRTLADRLAGTTQYEAVRRVPVTTAPVLPQQSRVP